MIQSSDPRGINFHVITLFPEMIESAVSFGVIGQAIKSGSIAVSTLSPRVFTSNVHQTVDDRPFGGGDGMVMMAEPLALATEAIFAKIQKKPQVIHLSPRGVPFTDAKARELAMESDLVLIASRYGGVDQRFLNEYVTQEISIGDYVLSGGDLAALVVIDSVSRHLPGVLGNETSPDDESFSPHGAGLEYPQFSRPREWRGEVVPEALLSGNHARIKEWKEALSLLVTLERRPDLLSRQSVKISDKLKRAAEKLLLAMSDQEIRACGLHSRELILKRLKVEV